VSVYIYARVCVCVCVCVIKQISIGTYLSSAILTSLAYSQYSTTNTNCCEYSIRTPDDGQYVCPKHIELFTEINLRNSASCWLPLYKYTTHDPQNIYIYIYKDCGFMAALTNGLFSMIIGPTLVVKSILILYSHLHIVSSCSAELFMEFSCRPCANSLGIHWR